MGLPRWNWQFMEWGLVESDGFVKGVQRVNGTGYEGLVLLNFKKNFLDRVSQLPLAFSLPSVSKQTNTESQNSPIAELFDVDYGRISIHHYEYKEYHLNVSGNYHKDMRWTV
ncbi:hypothetical protein Tco_0951026 [Tanacetum coccineum]|uniref:Uncharacterized protein n=1 Tax=Tanacetum coccineum TaxID=301880 RepID=A0ABQ5DT02_9ASTR